MTTTSLASLPDHPQFGLPPAYQESKAIKLDFTMPTRRAVEPDENESTGPPDNEVPTAQNATAKPRAIIIPDMEAKKARRQRAASHTSSTSSRRSRPPSPAPRRQTSAHHKADWKEKCVLGFARVIEKTGAWWPFGGRPNHE